MLGYTTYLPNMPAEQNKRLTQIVSSLLDLTDYERMQ